ncbi:MAG: alpha/beta fold hydrolase [Gillisia sp.]
MPVIKSAYSAPFVFHNYHLSTIYASQLRKAPKLQQKRQRLELQDSDFIDVDWSYAKDRQKSKLLLILHGLEGNAQRPYILGMAAIFNNDGWDVAAVNLRGCSGEINRLYRSYNAGASEDLQEIIHLIQKKNKYRILAAVGFSLGGNLLLKYLGEGNLLPSEFKAAAAISTPCDLYGSLRELEKPGNMIYARRFVKKLKKQLEIRNRKFPEKLSTEEIARCKTLLQIDDLYTSRAHGYKDAKDYYKRSSSLQFLPGIQLPVLLLNAQNDSFLSDSCYPYKLAEENAHLFLETPKYGGHVGFLQYKKETYAEQRALRFINDHI